MANWKSLFKAIIEGKMNRNVLFVSLNSSAGNMRMVLTPIKWNPDPVEREITFSGEDGMTSNTMSSLTQKQTFIQEDLGKWYAIEISGKVYAFPEKATTKLMLNGVRGLNEGPKFMRKVCSLYENLEFGKHAFPMSVQMWNCIPDMYRQEPQWFETRFDLYNGCTVGNGLQVARDGKLQQGLLYKDRHNVLNMYGVRPVVPLKAEVEVDLESDYENGLTLRIPQC